MSKCIYFVLLLIFWVLPVHADVYVHGYVKQNGTYVTPHYRSNPNGNFNDNWSTKPNINPYTGNEGLKVSEPKVRDSSDQVRNNRLSSVPYY